VLTMGPPLGGPGVARVAVPWRRRGFVLLSAGLCRPPTRWPRAYALARALDHLGAFRPCAVRRQAIDGDTGAGRPPDRRKAGPARRYHCVSRIVEVVPPGRSRGGARLGHATRSVEDGAETLCGAAARTAHHHRRGQRTASTERQARHDLTTRDRRSPARLRRQLPDPDSTRPRSAWWAATGGPCAGPGSSSGDAAAIEAERELSGCAPRRRA